MSNQLVELPHIYKKGKILKFKSLDPLTPKKYFFTSEDTKPSLSSITKHCNNLNQIVARCWLKLAKLNSYFGIQKDPYEYLSKSQIPYNLFWTNLQNYKIKDNENLELINLLKDLNKKLILHNFNERQIFERISNIENKLEEINLSLRRIMDI